jgi:hypothetical protein
VGIEVESDIFEIVAKGLIQVFSLDSVDHPFDTGYEITVSEYGKMLVSSFVLMLVRRAFFHGRFSVLMRGHARLTRARRGISRFFPSQCPQSLGCSMKYETQTMRDFPPTKFANWRRPCKLHTLQSNKLRP